MRGLRHESNEEPNRDTGIQLFLMLVCLKKITLPWIFFYSCKRSGQQT